MAPPLWPILMEIEVKRLHPRETKGPERIELTIDSDGSFRQYVLTICTTPPRPDTPGATPAVAVADAIAVAPPQPNIPPRR
jgi:hypothetical protein